MRLSRAGRGSGAALDSTDTAAPPSFPEPPHNSGRPDAEARFELLTGGFFRDVHRVLEPRGGLTILSDSRQYLQSLARTLGRLADARGDPLFSSVRIEVEVNDSDARKRKRPAATSAAGAEAAPSPPLSKKARKLRERKARERAFKAANPARFQKLPLADGEDVGPVRLYYGHPDARAGHVVRSSSYFDRFWGHGGHTDRYYLALTRA